MRLWACTLHLRQNYTFLVNQEEPNLRFDSLLAFQHLVICFLFCSTQPPVCKQNNQGHALDLSVCACVAELPPPQCLGLRPAWGKWKMFCHRSQLSGSGCSLSSYLSYSLQLLILFTGKGSQKSGKESPCPTDA